MAIKQRKERNRSRDIESDIRQTAGARQGLYLDTATGKVEEKKKRNGRKTKKIGQKEQEYKITGITQEVTTHNTNDER